MITNEQSLPDWKKKIINSKYASGGFGNYNNKALQDNFADIDARLKDIEHKINPTAKKRLSNRAQQMLILHHLGVLELINEFNISNKKRRNY